MGMRFVACDASGNLSFSEAPIPVLGDREILISVRAAGVNRADLMQRQGYYPPPAGASSILGLEVAGVVETVGAGVKRWKKGDAVMGILAGGGYASKAVMHEDMAMAVPSGLTYSQAAAIPEAYLTAFQTLVWIGGLSAGQSVLFHAGGSGVGTAAIQLASRIGARISVTASAAKHATCLALGADCAIDYKSEDFDQAVLQTTTGRGVDLIVDCVGAPYFQRNIRALAVDGCLVLISMLGGTRVEEIDLRRVFRKRATIVATTLRSRSMPYKIQLTRAFVDRFLDDFSKRALKPVIDSVFRWRDVEEAHAHMRANRNIGKIVLEIGRTQSETTGPRA